MKKLLLVIGWPPDTDHPTVDCLLTISLIIQQERGSRFLVVPHSGDSNSFEQLKNAVERMINGSSRSIKIVYIDCSPSHSEEINYLLKLSSNQVCVYIYDHHENDLKSSLTSALNVSYTCSSELPTAAMSSRFYYRSMSDKLWIQILTLQHFICFHNILAPDSFSDENSSLSDLVNQLASRYNINNSFKNTIEYLFYITRHVLDFTKSLDWTFRSASNLDIYQRTGQYLERAIVARKFMEDLFHGRDQRLFSKSDIVKYKSKTDYWSQLIASSALVSILTGETVKTRFIGTVVVRPHQNRGDAGPCWMIPDCAKALSNRSRALCLLDAAWKPGKENSEVLIRIHRASSMVNCLDVGLSVVNAMSPEVAILSGWPWESHVECSEAAYNRLEVHLKICRKAVELSNVRPLPQPVISAPALPKRHSRLSSQRRSGHSSQMSGRQSVCSPSQLSRLKGRRSRMFSMVSLESDSVFDV